MRATREIGSRCITFTGLPKVEGLDTPAHLEVRLRYTGDYGSGSKAIALDNVVIPGIIQAVNADADLVEACEALLGPSHLEHQVKATEMARAALAKSERRDP